VSALPARRDHASLTLVVVVVHSVTDQVAHSIAGRVALPRLTLPEPTKRGPAPGSLIVGRRRQQAWQRPGADGRHQRGMSCVGVSVAMPTH
jgi:hypothetical protein